MQTPPTTVASQVATGPYAALTRSAFRISLASAIALTIILLTKLDTDVLHHPPQTLPGWLTVIFKGVGILTTIGGIACTAINLYVRWQTRNQKKARQSLGARITDTAKDQAMNLPGRLQGLPGVINRLRDGQGLSLTFSVAVLGVAIYTTAVTVIPAAAVPAVAPTPKGVITAFHLPATNQGGGLNHLVIGPDGNAWFTDDANSMVGYVTPQGQIREFSPPSNSTAPIPTEPSSITAGPDGNVWYVGGSGTVGRVTPQGVITEYSLATPEPLNDITAGPDGNLWFAGEGDIGRITPQGNVTSFPIPPQGSSDYSVRPATSITAGPDGNLWFTMPGVTGTDVTPGIGRITPAGVITTFQLQSSQCTPYSIVAGADGALWFECIRQFSLGRITPNGNIQFFPIKESLGYDGSRPVIADPNGGVWFTDLNGIYTITPQGKETAIAITQPNPSIGFDTMAFDRDGKLWFVDSLDDEIGYLVP